MQTRREKELSDKPLETVANFMAGCGPGSENDHMAQAEFLLRQTKAQIEASEATKETAFYTKRYTRYMLWSVIILAVSAFGTLILDMIKHFATKSP